MADLTSRYVLWRTGVRPGVAAAAGFAEPIEYSSLETESVAATFPADVRLRLRTSGRVQVPDLLYNTEELLIVSSRVHALLAPKALPGVELLPVALVDGRGADLGLTVYILHTVEDPPCLDWEASKATSDRADGRWVDELEAIRLGTDPGRPLLRVRELPQYVLVERGLAREIAEAAFCGSELYEIESYARGVDFTEEREAVDAFPRRPEQPPIAVGAAPATKKAKRPKAPPAAVRKRIDALPVPPGTPSSAPPYLVDREGFLPLWGGDDWAEAYEPEEWPDFEPRRWFPVGTNGQGNYWLYDLDTGHVVYFSHELGFDDENCEVVDEDWRAFFDRIAAR